MSADLVLQSEAAGVVTLMLNRPEKLNALNPAVFEALRARLQALASRDDVVCVVLAGAGRSFCAGHDLADLAAGTALETRWFEAETIDLLEALPMPTIGRIHGHCLTGGLELILGCDLLVAAENARVGDTHAKWGLVPVWGLTVRLPERVGRSKARELMYTSRILDGRAAAEVGLVDHAVPEEELDAFIAKLAAEMAANSSGSNRLFKTLMNGHPAKTRAEALAYEREMPFGMAPDSVERLKAVKRS